MWTHSLLRVAPGVAGSWSCLGERVGVEQLVLELTAPAVPVRLDQIKIRVLPLRIFVEHPFVRMGRRRVEVEILFLDILAVVALGGRQPEQALLEDGVLAVPEGRGEAEQLVAVADAGDAVLAPAVGLAAGQVVGQVGPGVAVG
jgi:hypothetical protein